MAATFRLRLGTLDLSAYVKVNPDERMKPYGDPWLEPAFTETPFADGQPLISQTVDNREMEWPIFAQAAVGAAQTNLVTNPSFEYDRPGSAPAGWLGTDSSFLAAGSVLSADGSQAQVGLQSCKVLTTAVSLQGASLLFTGTFLSGVTYTASIWVRGTNSDQCRIVFGDPADGANAFFNLTNGSWVPETISYTPAADRTAVRLVIRQETAAAKTFWLDGAIVTQSAAAVNYGDGDSKGWLWNGTPGSSSSTSLVGKDGLHQLIRAIQNAASQRPLQLEWRDDSASASTFYDVAFARFEPDFDFRRSQYNYASGILRVWVSGYGHTGTTRVTATAAGTGIFLSVPIASLAGDAPALLDTTIVSGAVVPSLGRIIAVAPITSPSYTPRIPAASLTDLQTNATLIGASGADGSQYLALPVSPTGGASGVACMVPLPNPTIAGGDNRILAVVQSGIDAGIGLTALDPFGNVLGPTAVASFSQGFGVVDLGVCRLPTTGYPTLPKLSILAGAIWASGAAGPGILASPAALRINEILCLPDKNMTLLYERVGGGSVISRDGFTGNAPLSGLNDDLGNPWTKAFNNIGTNVLTEFGGLVTLGAGAGASQMDSAHLAGILSDSMLVSAKPLLLAGEVRLMKDTASGAYVQARVNRDTLYLDLGAATNGTLNLLASVALASNANARMRFSLKVQGGAALVNVTRDDGGALLVAGASSAFASLGASSAAVAAAGVPGFAMTTGASPVFSSFSVQSWEVDTIPSSNLLAFDSYRIDGPNADSYRTSSAGAFAGQKLVSVQRGAFVKMVPSTVSLAVVVAPVDQGVANDLISAAVSVRERYTYGR